MKEPQALTMERSLVFRGLVIAIYLGSNISLNMLNKWTLSLYGFRFPLLMGLAHMAFSFFALAPIMMMKSFRDLHAPTLQKQLFGVMTISTLFAMNVGLNNASLVSIPLSLNQVIRASIPIVAAVGSIFIEGKSPTLQEFSCLTVLFLGVAVAVWEGSSSTASFWGIVICILGTISNGLMMSSIGKLLSERVDVLRLTFYTAPITIIMLLPFYYSFESKAFSEYQAKHSMNYLGLLLLGCINALVYNLVHSYVIKITSAVTTTVIGEMKIILILVLSSIMLGESSMWTLQMLVGCSLAILGFCWYSHVKLAAAAVGYQPIIKGVPELPSGAADALRTPSFASTQPLLAR